MSRPSNQSGFAAVEAVLIIIILIIIGFVGWYVWHSSQKTNSLISSSNQQAQSPQPVKYLVVKEWGVRLPYQGTNTYTYKMGADNTSVDVVSSFLSKDYGCTDGGAGTIDQLQATQTVTGGSQTVAEAAQAHPGTYGHVGSNYYEFVADTSACSSKVTTSVQNQANDFVKALVPKAQAVPAAAATPAKP